jgi:hypothetical protein
MKKIRDFAGGIFEFKKMHPVPIFDLRKKVLLVP